MLVNYEFLYHNVGLVLTPSAINIGEEVSLGVGFNDNIGKFVYPTILLLLLNNSLKLGKCLFFAVIKGNPALGYTLKGVLFLYCVICSLALIERYS